jgi:hypothetical protein
MKTLIAAVAFAMVFAAPAFAQCWNSWGSWGCKGPLAAPASAKSASARSGYAAAFNRPRRVVPAEPRDCNRSPASLSYRTNCN